MNKQKRIRQENALNRHRESLKGYQNELKQEKEERWIECLKQKIIETEELILNCEIKLGLKTKIQAKRSQLDKMSQRELNEATGMVGIE